MKRIIKDKLSKKFSEFLELISDDELHERAERDAVIIGGCIASLLLKEEPKDYDIYFEDSEAVELLTKYFDEKWKDCNDSELGFVTDAAITFSSLKIQLITKWSGPIDEILKGFDFVHTQNYYKPYTDSLVLSPAAVESILMKELIYTGSEFPLCSVIRTRKFVLRGWNVSAGEYLKMLYQVSLLNLNNLDVLKEQLVGVDTLFFTEVVGYLEEEREKSELFELSMVRLCEIIDNVFMGEEV